MAVLSHTGKKRRTKDHVLADLSANHVERAVLECGWVFEPFRRDYSIDGHIRTFSLRGEVERGLIYVQIKARHRANWSKGGTIAVDVDPRDLRLWLQMEDPVLLVCFDGASARCWFVHVQSTMRASVPIRARSVRIHIPRPSVLDRDALLLLRQVKEATYSQATWRTERNA